MFSWHRHASINEAASHVQATAAAAKVQVAAACESGRPHSTDYLTIDSVLERELHRCLQHIISYKLDLRDCNRELRQARQELEVFRSHAAQTSTSLQQSDKSR